MTPVSQSLLYQGVNEREVSSVCNLANEFTSQSLLYQGVNERAVFLSWATKRVYDADLRNRVCWMVSHWCLSPRAIINLVATIYEQCTSQGCVTDIFTRGSISVFRYHEFCAAIQKVATNPTGFSLRPKCEFCPNL
jgi:hypothetical protein